MRNLTSAERSALRARAHHLHPVIMIGASGLTPAVMKEIDLALKSHELVKIRVLGDDRGQRKSLIGDICGALAAQPVQRVGKILVVFRERPEPAAPHAPLRRKKHRPKRRFQNQ